MGRKIKSPYIPGLGITNKYIYDFLKKFDQSFIGAFSCFELDPLRPKLGHYIINTGSHLIAIIIKQNEILYFDSYGRDCDNKYVKKFLDKSQTQKKINTSQIQSPISYFCGFFCILMCLYSDRAPSWPLLFSPDLEKNDFICINYINKCLDEAS